MSGRRGPYAKSSATRQRIVEAGLTVFSELGYHAATTSRIAREAGISEPQVSYHFANKESLLHAVLAERDRIADQVAGPVPADAAQVPAAFLRIAANNERLPGFVSLYLVLAAESTTPGHPGAAFFRARYGRLRRQFAGVFEAMDKRGLLAPGVSAAYAAARRAPEAPS